MSETPALSKEMQFRRAIYEERARQISVGYTSKHDQKRGIKHLVNIAIDNVYRERPIQAAAVLIAILELYRTINERRWFFIGIFVGIIATAIVISVVEIVLASLGTIK